MEFKALGDTSRFSFARIARGRFRSRILAATLVAWALKFSLWSNVTPSRVGSVKYGIFEPSRVTSASDSGGDEGARENWVTLHLLTFIFICHFEAHSSSFVNVF